MPQSTSPRTSQRVSVPSRARTARSLSRACFIEALEQRALLTTIDVMVVYDTDAKAQFGNSDPAIQKAIRQSLDLANLSHQNTGDNIVLRLVYTGLINYSNPNGTSPSELADLAANSTVAALRNTYGADQVAMIIQNSDATGGFSYTIASLAGSPNSAFSVVSYQFIGPGQNTLAHEFGHVEGAGHAKDDAVPAAGLFAYSYGYHTSYGGASIHGSDYGDVMTGQGNPLPVFSTPNFIHDGAPLGKPIGDPKAADLQSTFLATGPVIAAYRATVVANAAPTATLWQTDLSGNQLTFKVRYLDDIGVNAASLDDGDIQVQTPEGFHLHAQFLSVDAPGNTYAKVATYRITLPASQPPLSSLSYLVTAAQVIDTNGAAVPAGALTANIDGDLDLGFPYFTLNRDTGALAANVTRTLTGRLGEIRDTFDLYKFNVTSIMNLSAKLTGLGGALTSDPQLQLFCDVNLNETYQSNPNEYVAMVNPGGTGDRFLSYTLAPGTYYLYLYLPTGDPTTNYALSLATSTGSAASDSVPPIGTGDRADITSATSTLDFSVIYSDDQALNLASADSAQVFVFSPAGNFSTFPSSTNVLDSKHVVANYSFSFSNIGNGAVNVITAGSNLRDAAGNYIDDGALVASFNVAVGVVDTTAPSASLSSAPLVVLPGATPYDFVIAYQDNRAINAATLGPGDITVDGPAGSGITNLPAAFQSSTLSAGGAFRYATYRIAPPGGSWDWHDNGNYKIKLTAAQVKDTASLAVPANANLGTFNVHVPFPGDATGDNATTFADLVIVAQNYGAAGRGQATGDFNFDGLVNFADLVLVAQNYGTAAPASPVFAAAEFDSPLAKSKALNFKITPAKSVATAPPKPAKRPAPISIRTTAPLH